jgi:uncharacterized FlaG/YvyC family protein
MTEDEISASGQFSSLNSTDFASSGSGATPAAGAPAAQTAGSPATTSPAAPMAGSQATPSAAATTAAAAGANKSQRGPSSQEIQAAVDTANANLASSNRIMDFRVDAATGLTIATIRNSQTGAVLQQIPGANIMALAKMLADWSPGKHMLLDLIA